MHRFAAHYISPQQTDLSKLTIHARSKADILAFPVHTFLLLFKNTQKTYKRTRLCAHKYLTFYHLIIYYTLAPSLIERFSKVPRRVQCDGYDLEDPNITKQHKTNKQTNKHLTFINNKIVKKTLFIG